MFGKTVRRAASRSGSCLSGLWLVLGSSKLDPNVEVLNGELATDIFRSLPPSHGAVRWGQGHKVGVQRLD